MGRSLALVRAGREDRLRSAAVLAALLGWLFYTRIFWTLHAVHATLPPCPFLLVTGHPCPFCGGTRSFAAMWQGDVAGAGRYHPLGPPLFAGTLLAVAAVAGLIASGRRLRIDLALEKRLYVLAAAVFVLAWLLRLALLPLPAS